MLHIADHKTSLQNSQSEKYLSAKKLCLPLAQHTGKPSVFTSSIQTQIEEAQVLAQEDGHISSRLHAPAQGKVLSVEEYAHPVLKRSKAIIFEPSGKIHTYQPTKNVSSLTKEQLLTMIKEAGIVGMGGAAFPTHVKLSPPKKIETLIINGCECEPYLTCDARLMMENMEEIFKGIELICKIVSPGRVIFALEDNKAQAVKKINSLLSIRKFKLPQSRLCILKSRYPQGGEKQLIKSVIGKEVPPLGLPFDVGALVQNVATCFAISEAVYLGKPLIERMVTFSGDALVKPKNLWVKIGTTLKELFDQKILEFKHEPEKILCGGPMMGVTLEHLEYPILKGTGGFLFLHKAPVNKETPCIRCGRCVDICPVRLLPLEYAKRVKAEEFSTLNDFNIKDCIECGSCNFVCPAKIPLVHYIKTGKRYVPNS